MLGSTGGTGNVKSNISPISASSAAPKALSKDENELLATLAKLNPPEAKAYFAANKETAALFAASNPDIASKLGLNVPKPELKLNVDSNVLSAAAAAVRPSPIDPHMAGVATSVTEAQLKDLFKAFETGMGAPITAVKAAETPAVTKPTAAPAPSTQAQTSQVTVKAGDTLSKIAASHGMSLAELKALNPDLFKAGTSQGHPRAADGSHIYPGDTIKLPTKSGAVTAGGAVDLQVTEAQGALIKALQAELGKLQEADHVLQLDMKDPQKAAIAGARRNLLAQQMGGLTQELRVAQNFKVPANASSQDRAAIDGMFGKMNLMIPDMANPTKVPETQAQLAALGDLLHNPGMYDPHARYFTQDLVITSQAQAVENLQGRIMSKINALDDLIADLNDPSKTATAMARFQVLSDQVNGLQDVVDRVKTYQRPASLTLQQANAQAYVLGQVEETAKDLSDPQKHEGALAKLNTFFKQLQSAIEGAKS